MSTSTIVLAAPGTVTSSVRDVLRDWVAIGLVQPFLWLDANEIDEGMPLAEMVATHVQGSHAPRLRLQDHLADQRTLTSVRLVVVVPVGGETAEIPPAILRSVESPLRTLLPGRVIALQHVLPLHGAGGWRSDIAIPGWQTLVLAPEDSWSPSPTQPSTEFTVGGDRTEHTAHAAAALASIAALWTGMHRGPFDDGDQGSDPVAIRAFLRRLDASQVTSALRASLMDVRSGLPAPETSQGRCQPLSNPVAAGVQIVDAIGRRHAELFTMNLHQTSGRVREPISSWGAVKLFFSFLAGVVSRAPGNLVARLVTGTAQAISGRVQSALFGGTGSQFEVVTRGINAAGLPAGTREIGQVAQEVQTKLAAVLPSEPVVPDVSDLWTSVTNGALTLADGGERTPDVGPILIGGRAGVIPDTTRIAPPPDREFALPLAVAGRVGTPTVSPYDTFQQDTIADVMALAPANDAELTRIGEQFTQWRTRAAESYTGALGQRLANDVRTRTALLKSLLEKLQSRAESVDADAIDEERSAVRRLLVRFLVGLLGGAVIVAVVGYLGLVSALVLTAVAAALLIGWVAAHVVAAIKHQQRIFALIHASEQLEDELDVAAQNVPVVAEGVFLATTLYEQYLQWAPVLGSFLQQPFGPEVPAVPPARLEGLLPRAVGFGVVRPDPEQISTVAYELGRSIFQRGWLSPLWQALIDDAPRRLGPAGLALRDSPRALWSDTARSNGSLLRMWSQHVVANGIDRSAGDALWELARSNLLANGARQLTSSLLTVVDVQAQEAHGIRAPISGQEFFTALTAALGDVERHYFSPSLFTPAAQAQDVHRVARTVAIGRQDVGTLDGTASSESIIWITPADDSSGSLDQFLVVVQASRSAPGGSYTLRGPASSSDLRPTERVTVDDSGLSG